MKKLLASILLLSSFSALAETVYVMNNNAGGQIVLTTGKCNPGGKEYKNLRHMFARSADGMTIFGCYALGNGVIYAVWNDGQIKTYLPSDFSKVEIDTY